MTKANANALSEFSVDDVDFQEIKGAGREQYPILRFGGDLETLFERLDAEKPEVAKKLREEGKTREDDTIYAGETVSGELIGTVPMYSSEVKENWEERLIDGKKWFYNEHYLLKNSAGKFFGIHRGATTWKLGKTATAMTRATIPNPKVQISYIGHIEGKERLEKEFDVVLTKGTSAHVAKIKFSKDAVVKEFEAGVINFTRKPVPMAKNDKKLSDYDQSLLNYENAVANGAHKDMLDVMPDTTSIESHGQLTM